KSQSLDGSLISPLGNGTTTGAVSPGCGSVWSAVSTLDVYSLIKSVGCSPAAAVIGTMSATSGASTASAAWLGSCTSSGALADCCGCSCGAPASPVPNITGVIGFTV